MSLADKNFAEAVAASHDPARTKHIQEWNSLFALKRD
jgi:hypothetical protein